MNKMNVDLTIILAPYGVLMGKAMCSHVTE